jgi:hypothetical protein
VSVRRLSNTGSDAWTVQLEALDFQLRSKNLEGSKAAFTKAMASLEIAQKAVA